jgi:hypothetical protein
MPDLPRIFFVLGCVSLAVGILLLSIDFLLAEPPKRTTKTRRIEKIIEVRTGSKYSYASMPKDIGLLLYFGENIQLKGTASEVNCLGFKFYVLDKRNFQFWREGKAYVSYFEGENQGVYHFAIRLSPKAAPEMLFVVEGENRKVKIDGTVEWEELSILSVLTPLTLTVYGVSCVGAGIILILLFKGRKRKTRSLGAKTAKWIR